MAITTPARIRPLVVAFTAFVLVTGCASDGDPDELTVDSVEESPGDVGDLEALGDIDVEAGLTTIDITLPADFTEGLTQEALEQTVTEQGFLSATLNEDRTVTYTMTQARHSELLAELRESVQDSVDALIAPDAEIYRSVSFNDDLTEFTVSVNAENFTGESPGLEFALGFQASFYYIFSGANPDDQTIEIVYVDADTGETIATSNWP